MAFLACADELGSAFAMAINVRDFYLDELTISCSKWVNSLGATFGSRGQIPVNPGNDLPTKIPNVKSSFSLS